MTGSKSNAISTDKDNGKSGITQFIAPSSTFVRTQSRQGRNNHANTGPNTSYNILSP